MPDSPDAVDALATLAAKLDEVSSMLEARYPEDDMRRTFALVLILDFGMEWLRKQWAEQHAKEHGCGVSYERIPYSALFDGKVE